MNKIRRISLFGGPGCGKSTLASWLFAKLRMAGLEIEPVQEYVKAWTFIGRPPEGFDQIYIFGKQLHREDIVLRNNKSIVITESPLFLSTCYAKKNKTPGWEELVSLVDKFEELYPSLNLLIDRVDNKYKTEGRYQTESEALQMDDFIKSSMDEHKLPYHLVKYNDLDRIEKLIISFI